MNKIYVIKIQKVQWKDLLEKEMATHSSILAWKIPWIEELGGILSIRLQRVRHNLVTKHTHVSFGEMSI